MKAIRKFLPIAAVVLFMSAGTSCSLFNKNKTASTSQTVETPTETGDNTNIILKRDEPGMSTTMPIKKEIMRIDTMMFARISGLWTLRSINGVTLSVEKGDSEENRPYINFDGRDGKFYANDGCNTINGDFRINQTGQISINCLLTTLMACPDAKYDQEFKLGLANAATCKIEEEVDEKILNLYNEKGTLIMTLVRPETDFLNGSWAVKTIDGKSVGSVEVKMVIDIPELKVHGNTGCNVFNGTIFVDPDKNGSVQFRDVAVTRMMCPDIATETAFLVALEAVEYGRKVNGEAQLLNSAHQPVITMVPLKLDK